MKHLLIALFVLVSAPACSQISVKYMSAKRAFYHPGDTVRMVVVLKLNPQSCLDGMKKTYVYYSGCEDLYNKPWHQSPNKLFYKELLIKISTRARGKAKVTMTRDTDKDSFFRQESFIIK